MGHRFFKVKVRKWGEKVGNIEVLHGNWEQGTQEIERIKEKMNIAKEESMNTKQETGQLSEEAAEKDRKETQR